MPNNNVNFPLTAFQADMLDDLANHHGVSRQDLFNDLVPDLGDALHTELTFRDRVARGTEIKAGKNRSHAPEGITLRSLQRVPDVENYLAALDRLIEVAKSDTGQSRKVADFLLAWWNAGDCGGFDLTTLWQVDKAIADDMITVCQLIARVQAYPDSLGYKPVFQKIVREWRSEKVED